MTEPFLARNAFGRLVCKAPDGAVHEGVIPVRAFPIHAPEEGIALVSQEGRELFWFENIAGIDPETRRLIEEDLAAREFTPRLLRILSVSSFACPNIWSIETERGETSFVLNGEEDIRRIDQKALMIADKHGIQYLVEDIAALDRHSRKLLDRFL